VNELALFAGAGGGILGSHLLGWRTVCAVEWEPYPASVLCARQNDGFLPPFPIWDDVQTFDGRPWRGIVDVVSGGFPCQDISAAGAGAGIDGERSGMWKEMARVVHEVRPRFVFVENSPMLTSRGLGIVLGDLAKMGFDARWGVLGAVDVGAPHLRDRIWIRAKQRGFLSHAKLYGDGWREQQSQSVEEAQGDVDNPGSLGSCRQATNGKLGGNRSTIPSMGGKWWEREPESTPRTTQPELGGVAYGVADRMDRLKAIGNGQVSEVARRAWELLSV
jgi:DNA (cytosine-5)-methyltransferase 1